MSPDERVGSEWERISVLTATLIYIAAEPDWSRSLDWTIFAVILILVSVWLVCLRIPR